MRNPIAELEARGFVLDPNNKLLTTTMTDLMDTSETNQTKWGQTLAQYYYGSNYPIKYTYWNGCSTGGRQAFEQAMNHPELYDGMLGGLQASTMTDCSLRASIFNLPLPISTRWIVPGGSLGAAGTAEGCNNGVSTTFQNAFTAANAQAVTACDTLGLQGLGNDIVADGVIADPRYCTFDATTPDRPDDRTDDGTDDGGRSTSHQHDLGRCTQSGRDSVCLVD